jgi:hypothetical protein
MKPRTSFSLVFTVVHFLLLVLGGWLVWHLTAGLSPRVRLVFLGAFVLGFVQSALHRWVARGGTVRPSRRWRSGL